MTPIGLPRRKIHEDEPVRIPEEAPEPGLVPVPEREPVKVPG